LRVRDLAMVGSARPGAQRIGREQRAPCASWRKPKARSRGTRRSKGRYNVAPFNGVKPFHKRQIGASLNKKENRQRRPQANVMIDRG
jgi:hypothetical protein